MKSTSPKPTEPAPGTATLTPSLAQDLVLGAQTGLFRAAVAESRSLNPDVLDTWLAMGLSSDATEPYRSFALQYRAAEQLAQLPYINAIQRAATEDYRAAIEWLKLRYPDQWGKDATKNQSAGVLTPTAGDEVAEEALVAQLFELEPPVLLRLLDRFGYIKVPVEGDSNDGEPGKKLD